FRRGDVPRLLVMERLIQIHRLGDETEQKTANLAREPKLRRSNLSLKACPLLRCCPDHHRFDRLPRHAFRLRLGGNPTSRLDKATVPHPEQGLQALAALDYLIAIRTNPDRDGNPEAAVLMRADHQRQKLTRHHELGTETPQLGYERREGPCLGIL